jgi:hypothetical protein
MERDIPLDATNERHQALFKAMKALDLLFVPILGKHMPIGIRCFGNHPDPAWEKPELAALVLGVSLFNPWQGARDEAEVLVLGLGSILWIISSRKEARGKTPASRRLMFLLLTLRTDGLLTTQLGRS